MGNNMISLRDLLHELCSHWRRLAVCVIVSAVAAAAYLQLATPVYESEALLRIKQQQGGPSVLTATVDSGIDSSSGIARKERMSTYSEILKSRNVIEPILEAAYADGDAMPPYEIFIGNVVTTPLKDTELLKVTVSDTDPMRAQAINSAVMESFMSRLTELSHAEKNATKEFLEGRVKDSDAELTEAENKLKAYQIQEKFVSPDAHLKELVSRLSNVKKEDEATQVDLAAAQALYSSVSGQLSQNAYGMADNTTIRQYNSKLVDLEVKRIGLLEKYTESHPEMVALNQQISEARAARDAEISRVAGLSSPSDNSVQQGLLRDMLKSEAQISVDRSKAAALEKVNAEAEKELSAMPEKEQGFVRAQRDVNVAQDIYTMLYKRLEDAKIAEVMVPNEVQLLDAPTLPEKPVRPKKRSAVLLFLAIGMATGILAAVGPSLVHRRIKSGDDVEYYLGVEVIGSVPDFDALQSEMNKLKWYERLGS